MRSLLDTNRGERDRKRLQGKMRKRQFATSRTAPPRARASSAQAIRSRLGQRAGMSPEGTCLVRGTSATPWTSRSIPSSLAGRRYVATGTAAAAVSIIVTTSSGWDTIAT